MRFASQTACGHQSQRQSTNEASNDNPPGGMAARFMLMSIRVRAVAAVLSLQRVCHDIRPAAPSFLMIADEAIRGKNFEHDC